MRRLLLAHGTDAETLAAIPALAERYAASVVTLTIDVGQDGNTMAFRDRAVAAGAIRAHVIDARETFARDYVLRLLQAGGASADAAGQGAALLRLLVTEKLLEIAAMEGATFIAHPYGAHPDAAAHVEGVIRRRAPGSVVIAAGAPAGSPAARAAADPHRVIALETTLWWRRVVVQASSPAAATRDIPAIRAGIFTVATPDRCPQAPASLALTFRAGVPSAVNGIDMPLVELIEAADTIAGDHGVGRLSTTVAADGGWRTEIVETPAAVVLSTAYAALAKAVASPGLWRVKRHLGREYAGLLRSNQWSSDTRAALDTLAAATQDAVTGTVRLRLQRGRCRVIAREVASPGPAVTTAARPAPRHAAPPDPHPGGPAMDAPLPH